MTKPVVLIAGATGLVGAAAIEHYAARGDRRIVALSRRKPEGLPQGAEHVAVDLTDAEQCRERLGTIRGIDRIVFAALYEKPDLIAGWRDPQQMAVNLAMLRNLLDAVEPASPDLAHLILMQGTKAYGAHIVPMRAPAKERWPRHDHENFYWLQEDLVRERAAKAGWGFTILRPPVLFGYAAGSPMNVVLGIGAYAAIMRELGEPLRFPGGGERVTDAADTLLLARAAAWAADTPAARNETYNVGNGDNLIWQHLFPAVARLFGMEEAAPRPMKLAAEMPKQEAAWARIVETHGLRPTTLDRLVGSSWEFTDRSVGEGDPHPAPSILSTIKIRQAGFQDCIDTEDSLLFWLRRLQERRILPR